MIAAAHQPAPVEQVALHDIRTDGGTQARAALNDETVAEYAANIEANDAMPPVVVFYDGSAYWLADGFHRVAARAKVGRLTVKAEVRQGTRRDAVLYACGANATHGLRRTNADKRRAVETLLRDEEWSQWPQAQIAKACGVSREYVSRVFGEVKASCDRSQDAERTVERNGKTYTQNTANIGRKPASRAEEPKVDEPTASRAVAAPAPSPVAVEPDEDDEDYSNLDDLPPEVVRVEPEPFASVPVDRPPASLAVERMAADLAGACRAAHSVLAAALAKVPAAERAAVLARIDRPVLLLLDVVEQLAPASAPTGWRPTVINGGRK